MTFYSRLRQAGLAEICGLAIVVLVAAVFMFFQIPGDFGDDPITSGIVSEAIIQGHKLGEPASQVFQSLYAGSNGVLLSPSQFEIFGYTLPLWHFLLSLDNWIFGVSVFDTLFLASFVGFFTVVLVYVLAKEMYGVIVGLLSAILLASSLLFVILVRSGSGFDALVPLTAVAALYLVYTAHQRRSPRRLWASGVAIGVALFDAYPPVYLLIPILGLFLIWNLDFRAMMQSKRALEGQPEHSPFRKYVLALWKGLFSKFLGIWDYILALAIGIETFFLSTIGFDVYVGAPLLTTAELINSHWLSQPSLLTLGAILDLRVVLTSNIKDFFGEMFVAVNPYDSLSGAHTQQYLTGEPYVFPLVSIFLVIGLVFSTLRRTTADKMCLAWLLISVVAITVLTGFDGRTAIIMAPVVCILAANGMVQVVRLFRGGQPTHVSVRFPSNKKLLAASIIILTVGFTTYTSYQDVFGTYYGAEDGRIPFYYGNSGVYSYIMGHSLPGNSQIVLGDPVTLPYNAFIFYTGGEDPMIYWQDAVGPSPGMIIQNASALGQWERTVLESKSSIFYVFALGGRYAEWPGWDFDDSGVDQSVTYLGAPTILNGGGGAVAWFRDEHPFLQPVQTIYNNNGTPAFALFEINETTVTTRPVDLTAGSNDVMSPEQSNFRLLSVSGPASNLLVSVNNSSLAFPANVLPDETDSITWNNNSQIVFQPLIQSQNYSQDVYAQQNVGFNSSQGSAWLQSEGSSGYVTYRIESPFGKIDSVAIQTDPRIYNDPGEKNTISLSYSINGNDYSPIYTVTSNGDGQWSYYMNYYSFYTTAPVPFQSNSSAGVNERQTYNEIYPNSNVVYLRFTLTGQAGQEQLWSLPGPNRMYFIANFDSSSAPQLTLQTGPNDIRVNFNGSAGVSFATASLPPANE